MTTALITGASRGIGAATARVLAAHGFDLLLLARSADALEQLASDLRPLGPRIEVAAIDLADPAAIEDPLRALCERAEPPDVLINNAGAAYTGGLTAMAVADWQWLLQLNLTSVFQVCRTVVPLMRARGGGLIINVSSHAARHAFPDWGAYCVSKAALASLSRCLAEEERCHGIRVSTLTLGAVNTPLWDSETVHSSFDRRAMLDPYQVAQTLLQLAQQPAAQVSEDLTLMPAVGAF
jgi:short-subunit dehydrogenase